MRTGAVRPGLGRRWVVSPSIRTKLVVSCLLVIVTVGSLGAFNEVSQQRIGTLATEIYDRAFLAMSYLRSSQNGLAKLLADIEHLEDDDERRAPRAPSEAARSIADAWLALSSSAIPEILSDVDIAHGRALSPEGAVATERLEERLHGLEGALGARDLESVTADIQRLQGEFDTAVEIYAGDGYHYRRDVQTLIERSLRDTLVAIAIAVAAAVAITVLVARSIIPALRKAVAVARSISDGKLDNVITARGSDEAALLLRALGTMQASLAQKIRRIDALAAESSERAAQLALQNGRFEAALDNMQQGLRMFDAHGQLVVANRRFAEMFGAKAAELPAPVLADAALAPSDEAPDGPGPSLIPLGDGRVVSTTTRPVRAGGWVVTYEDVTERHEAEMKLRHMARHDALTGLPNRVMFREHVERIAAKGASEGGPAVLCLDLDGFKEVNDTHGHPFGDDLLRAVARRLRDGLHPREMVARLGGDEFAVVLASGDASAAEACAQGLVRIVSQPFLIAGHRIFISAGVGVSTRGGTSASDTDLCTVLLRNADVALYQAKGRGRGAASFYSPELDAAVEDGRQMRADLALALERNEFSLLFQPLVDAATGVVQAFEALLRWNHPVRGTVSPVTFVPLAEESGAIVAIGEWVLRIAAVEAVRWPSDVRVAVNLSAKQFRQGGLALSVTRILADTGLSPSRLELEITETALLSDDEAVLATLGQLRAIGVRIALDDFGTGYSSLSYLHRLPLDKIKIDKSFVDDLATPTNAAILKAVVALGRALDLVVVAEGVESLEQSEHLREQGCAQLQGYLFGKPGPAADVPRVIGRLNGAPAFEARIAS